MSGWLPIVMFAVLLVLLVILWRRRGGDPLPQDDAPPSPPASHDDRRSTELAAIAAQQGWTAAAYDEVLAGRIAPGMTPDMVLMAWGGPTHIDHRTRNARGVPVERWVYRDPQHGQQQLVWFAGGKVARVEAV